MEMKPIETALVNFEGNASVYLVKLQEIAKAMGGLEAIVLLISSMSISTREKKAAISRLESIGSVFGGEIENMTDDLIKDLKGEPKKTNES